MKYTLFYPDENTPLEYESRDDLMMALEQLIEVHENTKNAETSEVQVFMKHNA